jgi:hypothetical protein
MTFDRLRNLIDHLATRVTTDEAYRAGYDCGRSEPNSTNCGIRFFSRPELTAAWERGRADSSTGNVPATPVPATSPTVGEP